MHATIFRLDVEAGHDSALTADLFLRVADGRYVTSDGGLTCAARESVASRVSYGNGQSLTISTTLEPATVAAARDGLEAVLAPSAAYAGTDGFAWAEGGDWVFPVEAEWPDE